MERDTVNYPTAARNVSTSRGGPPPDEGLLDEATREIRAAASDLYELGGVLREHVDITLGHQPQPSANGKGTAGDTPIRADQLRNSIGALRNAIGEMREQVVRARRI